MGFMKPLAKIGTFGLAGLALSKNKKPAPTGGPVIQGQFPRAPQSMLGAASRGRSLY